MDLSFDRRQSSDCPNGGLWYVCAADGYQGCCLVDACQSHGCPAGKDRTPGSSTASFTRGSPESTALDVDSSSSPTSPVETFASISAGQTVFITVTRDSAPTSTSQPTTDASLSSERSSHSGTPIGAIAGGTIGGLILLASIIFLIFFLRRKKRRKEERRATLPPPYAEDMSEQLAGTTTATTNTDSKLATIGNGSTSTDSVQQLDSTAVVPTTEANVDPLGNIPELPDSARNAEPFVTADLLPGRNEKPSGENMRKSDVARPQRNSSDHVMSWAQYNSLGNRNPESRLSQPHMAPDATVWENLSAKKE